MAADVNGDGKLDLITANYGDAGGGTLSVMTNNGTGGFVLASSPSVGTGPRWVTAADVNGDGKVDLISANYGGFPGTGNTFSVLTNSGNGTFALASSPILSSAPYAVVAVDVNGDGKVDLISANADSTLTVLTNNGSGSFGLSSAANLGGDPRSVTAFTNVNGKVDLISANYGASTLTVLTNNGKGGFALAATLAVGNNPLAVTAADVNGDGKADLISANSGNNTLTVLINTTPRPSPQATGTAITSFGFVVSVTVNNGGYGYTNTPGVYFGGNGTAVPGLSRS